MMAIWVWPVGSSCHIVLVGVGLAATQEALVPGSQETLWSSGSCLHRCGTMKRIYITIDGKNTDPFTSGMLPNDTDG